MTETEYEPHENKWNEADEIKNGTKMSVKDNPESERKERGKKPIKMRLNVKKGEWGGKNST